MFLWDEVPWMLESIARNNGLNTAAEVLDTLRSLRIEHNRFRVVLTGSIGLHHVLGKLSAAGIPTSATNDLYAITVPPLSPSDASRLAADLLHGENILMDADHYISRNTNGGFHFRFPLIQRWWKLERGL